MIRPPPRSTPFPYTPLSRSWLARHRGGLDPAMAMNYGSYFETVQAAGVGVFWPSLSDLPRPLGNLTLNWLPAPLDRKSTRLNSSHSQISYAVFCLKKKKQQT